MFNLTACTQAFARDTLLVPRALDVAAECVLALPVYYIFLIIFCVILFLVAVTRTTLVSARIKKVRQRYGGGGAEGGQWTYSRRILARLSPYLTLIASWGSFVILILLMLLPLVVEPLNNSMIFLIGLQYAFFNILAELWLMKMIRLGAKIISPALAKSLKNSDSSNSAASPDQATMKIYEYLGQSDGVLRAFHVFIVTGIVFQIVCLCILCMILDQDSLLFLKIGIGMQGFNIFMPMCALIWQYERCSVAIGATSKGVQAIAHSSGRNKAVGSVIRKFRMHQAILAFFGSVGSLVFLLWGLSVFQISYAVIIVNALFDAFVNCGVLVTFVKRDSKKGRLGTSNLNSGTLIMGDTTKQGSVVLAHEPRTVLTLSPREGSRTTGEQ